jgi:hydrogenase maturation protein HypF
LPVSIGERLPCILAVGGHLKNAVALSVGSEVVVGSHVGDLDHPWSVDVHRAAIEDLVSFFDASPEAVACDLHPDYASTRQAELLAARWNVPLVRVQHHHAHVAACAAEHRLRGPVLGLAWDGTGAGTDGTVWGGEALWCCGAGFARVAHMRTFPLPRGDAVAREPRRSCLGLLFEVLGTGAADVVRDWFDPGELRTLLQALERPGMFVRSSSLGRVFDGVAALCGLGLRSSHEGQAAMSLEFASDECRDEAYPLPFQEKDPAVADWEPLLRAVLDDRRRGVHVGRIASRFHNALAGLAVETGRCAGGARVVVTGGCFQNAVLTERVSQRLESAGFEVWIPQQLPPGDGGISLGQVWVAAEQLKRLRGADDVPGNPRKGAGDLSAGHAADGAG